MANHYYYFSPSTLNPYAPEFFPGRKYYYSMQSDLLFSPLPSAPTAFIIRSPAFPPLALSSTSPPSFYFPGAKSTSPEFELHAQSLPQDLFYSPLDLSPEHVLAKTPRIIHEKKAKNGGGRGSSFEYNMPPRLRRQDCTKTNRTVWKVKGGDEVRFSEAKESDKIDKFSRVVEYKAQKKRGMKFEVQQVHEDENKTTVMIRNIPSKYTRGMVLEFLDNYCLKANKRVMESSPFPQAHDEDEGYLTAYDFFYMPMDFKTGMNKSYAFVNFSDPRAVWKFSRDCFMKDWEHFQSSKKMEIAIAKYQGKDQLIERFGKTAFACENDEFLPVCFEPPRDGSNNGELESSNVGKRIPKKGDLQKMSTLTSLTSLKCCS